MNKSLIKLQKAGLTQIQRNADTHVLFSAIRHNEVQVVASLLKQGADADGSSALLLKNCRDEHDNTALHIACQNGHRRVVQLLVAQVKETQGKLPDWFVNSFNRAGNTPLHFCKAYNYDLLYRTLVGWGADPNLKNVAGSRASEGLGDEPFDPGTTRLHGHWCHWGILRYVLKIKLWLIAAKAAVWERRHKVSASHWLGRGACRSGGDVVLHAIYLVDHLSSVPGIVYHRHNL